MSRFAGSAHPSPDQISAFFQQHDVRDVECLFADISGYSRGKLMPADRFAAKAELRICQAIPMQAVTSAYSNNPVFPLSPLHCRSANLRA